MKKFPLILTIFLLCALVCVLCACGQPDEPLPEADYSSLAANDYRVSESKTSEFKLFIPEAENLSWGFVFYLGTAMSTDNYDNILRKIAAAGVAVCVPANPFPDLLYEEKESAFDLLGAQNYFFGGHSQGGGAAVRRACENLALARGVVLYSPLVSNDFTLADKTLPAIYFEAENDNVLSAAMQNNAKHRMNENCEFVTLTGAGHMCYGTSSLLDGGGTIRDKAEIQAEVAQKTLAFMQQVIDESAT